MSYESNIYMLKTALELLQELSDEVVFVGGATTSLYVDKEISHDIRPTEDVDCVIEVTSTHEYRDFEKKLLGKGFSNDTTKGAPVCRFRFKDILLLDVMPTNDKIFGFSNPWYKMGIKNKITKKIENHDINIFQLEYFLASKVIAFNSRGKQDPRLSWDLEDIILVIDGQINFYFKDHNKELTTFLKSFFELLSSNREYREAVQTFLINDRDRVNRFYKRIDL